MSKSKKSSAETKTSIPRTISKKTTFRAHCQDGYSVRNTYDFCKIFSEIPWHVNDDGIKLCANKTDTSSNRPILNTVFFFGATDLLFFSFDSTCCSDLENKCHLFNIDTDKLASIAKNAATNDAIEMWHYEGEKKMNIKIFSKKGISIHTINMKPYIETSIYINHPTLEAEKSNFNERLETFTDACSTLTKSKSVSATTQIICHPSCIIMESDNPQGGQHPFGRDTEDLCPEPFVYTVSPDIIKALVKMKNFNKRGIVKFFYSDDLLLRIETNIGTFGIATLLFCGSTASP